MTLHVSLACGLCALCVACLFVGRGIIALSERERYLAWFMTDQICDDGVWRRACGEGVVSCFRVS